MALLLLCTLFAAGCSRQTEPEIVVMGRYEQDNDLTNGPEPIEWIVVRKDKEKTLLLAKDIIEYMPYNDMYGDEDDNISLVYWQDCTLRAWLGGEFYETAFTDEERAKIMTVTLKNPVERDYFYSEGEDTQETVFLLSKDEIKEYFKLGKALQAKPSEYARAKGLRVNPSGYSKWWLRTFGDEDHAYYISDIGNICKRGFYIYYYNDSEVRPAMYIANE